MKFKNIATIIALNSSILMAGVNYNTESIIEGFLEGKFDCKETKCVSSNTIINDVKNDINIKNTEILFLKKPELNTKDLNILAKETCTNNKETIDLEKCTKEEIISLKEKDVGTVTRLIKEISFKNIVIYDKSKDENINIEEVLFKKKGTLSINKSSLKKLSLKNIIVNSTLHIKGMTTDSDLSKTKMEEKINELFKKDLKNSFLYRKMYTILMTKFLEKNKLNKDVFIALKSEKKGDDLDVKVEINSISKNIGEIKSSLLFKVEKIEKSIEMFNMMNSNENQNKAGLGALMALTQYLLVKEVNVDIENSKLREIHLNLLKENKEYKENYNELISSIDLSTNKNTSKLDIFYRDALTLKKNTSRIKIKNVNDLKAMELFLSFSSPNIEKMLDIKID